MEIFPACNIWIHVLRHMVIIAYSGTDYAGSYGQSNDYNTAGQFLIYLIEITSCFDILKQTSLSLNQCW